MKRAAFVITRNMTFAFSIYENFNEEEEISETFDQRKKKEERRTSHNVTASSNSILLMHLVSQNTNQVTHS